MRVRRVAFFPKDKLFYGCRPDRQRQGARRCSTSLTAIVGGSKVSSKIEVLENLLTNAMR